MIEYAPQPLGGDPSMHVHTMYRDPTNDYGRKLRQMSATPRPLLRARPARPPRPRSAHRLDEYLQATTIAVEKGRVQVELRLVPGVAVFPIVFAGIDSDSDGIASPAEQRSYAERVIGDLSLSADGMRLPLRLVSSTICTEGAAPGQDAGRFDSVLAADVPARSGQTAPLF